MIKDATKEPLDINAVLESSRGKDTKAFLDTTPAVMAELTQQMITNKDIRVRERIRAEMKGILNFILADTEYPQQPVDKTKRVIPAGQQATDDVI